VCERADKYRRFAEECLLMASNAEDEKTRAIFHLMAQVWFRLALEKQDAEKLA
jgi:hypothetical protein